MQRQLSFDKLFYKRLLLTSIILNASWAFIGSIVANRFEKDLGLIILGFVFIIIYSLTYFLSFDKSKKNTYNFVMLTLVLICIFLAATFVVPFLTISFENKIIQGVGLLIASFFPIISIVTILTRYREIQHKKITILITTSLTFIATLILFVFADSLKYDTDTSYKILNPMAMGFCIWQILTTSIIGKSMAYK